MVGTGFVAKMLFLTGGFLVWAAHFTFIYGFNGLACARQFAGTTLLGIGIVPAAVAAATAVALALNAGILVAAALGRGPGVTHEADASVRQFWRFVAGVTAALSLVAVAWSGVPVLLVRPCA